jgi:hypothetical protein
MQQFQQLLPADWHDHMAHLAEHNKLRMMPTYEKWPTWKRALFESHIAGHQAVILAQMEQSAGFGQPPNGGLPDPNAQEETQDE